MKLLSIVLTCLISLITFNTSYAKKIIYKRVDVKVISGTYTGKTGYALFSYDQDKATGALAETIDGEQIVFNFLDQQITGKPQIILASGQFQNVAWVATAKNPQGQPFNFGFNNGFDRNQFGNASEAFIVNGGNYFAYLQPSTYVDGAGMIAYSDI